MAQDETLVYWSPSETAFDEIDDHDVYGQAAEQTHDEQLRQRYDDLLAQDAVLMAADEVVEESDAAAEIVGVALIFLYILAVLFFLVWTTIGAWFLLGIIGAG